MEVKKTDSTLHVISADGPLQHGLQPTCVIFDELWVQKKRDLFEALAGGLFKRDRALLICISTAGYDQSSLLAQECKRGEEGDDPRFFFHWHSADQELPYDDPKTWKIANPALSCENPFMRIKGLEDDLRRMHENEFRRWHLNQWTASEDTWITAEIWDACDGEPQMQHALPTVLGVDASIRRDSTVVATVQRHPDGVYHVAFKVWEPKPGKDIPLEEVEEHIREQAKLYNVIGVVYDPQYMHHAAQRLSDEGIEMVEWRQDNARMVPATRTPVGPRSGPIQPGRGSASRGPRAGFGRSRSPTSTSSSAASTPTTSSAATSSSTPSVPRPRSAASSQSRSASTSRRRPRGVIELFEQTLRGEAVGRILGKGYSPADYTLLCYGGGGPLHVAGYSADVAYKDVLVPAWAAGFSAYGCACADFEYRYDQTVDYPIEPQADELEKAGVAMMITGAWLGLADRVAEEFAKSGVDREAISFIHIVRMQYFGQLNDIEIVSPRLELEEADHLDELIATFEAAYAKVYARSARSPELGYLVTHAVVTGHVEVEKPVLPDLPAGGGEAPAKGAREVWWGGGFTETPLYELADVGAGQTVHGPAVIKSPATTFALPPGRAARLDRNGIFHLRA